MNAHHPTTTPASQGDFISIAPAVCERLLGEPSSRSARELRWGRKGSFRLKLNTGTWSDFEAGEGGGVLALVMREERLDKAGALAWLETQGSFVQPVQIARKGKIRRLRPNFRKSRRRTIAVQPRNKGQCS